MKFQRKAEVSNQESRPNLNEGYYNPRGSDGCDGEGGDSDPLWPYLSHHTSVGTSYRARTRAFLKRRHTVWSETGVEQSENPTASLKPLKNVVKPPRKPYLIAKCSGTGGRVRKGVGSGGQSYKAF